MTSTSILRTLLTRFLVAVLLFGFLGTGMDNAFEHGHSDDLQRIVLQDCVELADTGDLEPFLPQVPILPACTNPPDMRHVIAPVQPVQAIYSPAPRPPGLA